MNPIAVFCEPNSANSLIRINTSRTCSRPFLWLSTPLHKPGVPPGILSFLPKKLCWYLLWFKSLATNCISTVRVKMPLIHFSLSLVLICFCPTLRTLSTRPGSNNYSCLSSAPMREAQWWHSHSSLSVTLTGANWAHGKRDQRFPGRMTTTVWQASLGQLPMVSSAQLPKRSAPPVSLLSNPKPSFPKFFIYMYIHILILSRSLQTQSL